MKSYSTATWKGSGKEGYGTMSSKSSVLNNDKFDFKSRFEGSEYTNPEELVAAAHAGCFSMKLSFVLGAAGFTPEAIDTKCTITLENGAITNSHLEVHAIVPGMDALQFSEAAADAKANCPISKLLNTEITMEAELA